MLVIRVSRGAAQFVQVFERPRISIGRDRGCDLPLVAEGVERAHARIEQRGDRYQLEPVGAVWLGGVELAAPREIGAGDRIAIGPFVLEIDLADGAHAIAESPPRAPVEEDLLASIEAGDADGRTVYADWLESRGETTRAEFLRLQTLLREVHGDPKRRAKRRAVTERLRALAGAIDVGWRARVARAPIERCRPQFALACPKDWGSLAPTDRRDVRFCAACQQPVYYSATIREARAHAARGACVAIDARLTRTQGDLVPAPLRVGRIRVPGAGPAGARGEAPPRGGDFNDDD